MSQAYCHICGQKQLVNQGNLSLKIHWHTNGEKCKGSGMKPHQTSLIYEQVKHRLAQ